MRNNHQNTRAVVSRKRGVLLAYRDIKTSSTTVADRLKSFPTTIFFLWPQKAQNSKKKESRKFGQDRKSARENLTHLKYFTT